MPVSSSSLDKLLGLGEQIAEAIEAENWSRLSRLVDRRSQIAQHLESSESRDRDADSSGSTEEKLYALADQNDRLTDLLRERRDEIEEEIVRTEQMREAQDSYHATPGRQGILPSELRG